MVLFLRTYVDCEDSGEANSLQSRVLNSLSSFSPKLFGAPQQYWKIPEMFEFAFTLSPANVKSFEGVISLCDAGWMHMGTGDDLSSVWNRNSDDAFLIPEVAWAELALFEQ